MKVKLKSSLIEYQLVLPYGAVIDSVYNLGNYLTVKRRYTFVSLV